MNFSCPQCSFTSQFASALAMHRQLEHGAMDDDNFNRSFEKPINMPTVTSMTLPRVSGKNTDIYKTETNIASKGLTRSNSATRLLDRLRTRICKSKMGLFVHQEESTVNLNSANKEGRKTLQSSSKLFNDGSPRRMDTITESYRCHLCQFVADRITVLDRHLLNDHKIGLDTLLKLVMAKTKEGVSESFNGNIYDTYYKSQDFTEEGDIIVETVSPSIKILKHASTNTVLKWTDIPDYKMDCKAITQELEGLMSVPLNEGNQDELFTKMQRLSDYMCKFMESSSVLKRVLKKESKSTIDSRKNNSINDEMFNYGIGDQDSHRDWSESNRGSDKQSRHDKPKSATYNNFCY